MKQLRPHRAAALAALLAAAACAGGAREGANDSSASPPDLAAEAPKANVDTVVAWKYTPPDAWKERTTSALVSAEDRAKYFQNARAAQRFDYLPRDTTLAAQTLLLITVYDSTAWAAIEKEEGPPVGEVITREGAMVYIASLPQSNPFAEKSADYAAFEKRSVTLDQVKKGFQVVSR